MGLLGSFIADLNPVDGPRLEGGRLLAFAFAARAGFGVSLFVPDRPIDGVALTMKPKHGDEESPRQAAALRRRKRSVSPDRRSRFATARSGSPISAGKSSMGSALRGTWSPFWDMKSVGESPSVPNGPASRIGPQKNAA